MFANTINDDLCVKYYGFTPSREDGTALNSITNDLFAESPSEAYLKASFSKIGESFRGSVAISSSVGKFFVLASDENLKSLGDKLLIKTRQQLNDWKKLRFWPA